MAKQITFVIENDEGELYSSMTSTHIFWTILINRAKLFDNVHLAERENKIAKGTVKRLRYTLETINL